MMLPAEELNMDWSGCPAVIARPEYLSGKPALRDDPRVSPETVVVNMDEGISATEVIELFGLRTPPAEIQAVYDHALRQRVPTPV
jgi:uncharacterized protein (DUF433 family)